MLCNSGLSLHFGYQHLMMQSECRFGSCLSQPPDTAWEDTSTCVPATYVRDLERIWWTWLWPNTGLVVAIIYGKNQLVEVICCPFSLSNAAFQINKWMFLWRKEYDLHNSWGYMINVLSMHNLNELFKLPFLTKRHDALCDLICAFVKCLSVSYCLLTQHLSVPY